MAAVAGAIAEQVGRGLLAQGVGEVLVENGGDLFLRRTRPVDVAVFAAQSPLSGRVAIRVPPDQMPCGVCCSSGTVGHSLSLGKADAVVVVSRSAALADAAATGIANLVDGAPGSVEKALARAREIGAVDGVVVVLGDRLGAWGRVELAPLA